jgi:prophage regulatory protein
MTDDPVILSDLASPTNAKALERGSSSVLISYEQLLEMGVQFSKEHLRRLEKCGLFPERVRLSPKRVAWALEEVEAWLLCRKNQRSFIN